MMLTIKHTAYTLATLFVYAFGLLLLNQAQELNNLAKTLSLAIISFAGYLSYELITTEDYKLSPMLVGFGTVVTLIGIMCLYF
jgi:hypothetical protein